jgi:AhpD family alkylhydroperoxidase
LTWVNSALCAARYPACIESDQGETVTTSYTQVTEDINRGIAKIREGAPDAMTGFRALAKGAMKPGALSSEQKELIALAIGVADHCDGCIGFHARKLARTGTSRQQIIEALAVAVYMGGGPSLMYAANAIHAFDEFQAGAAAHSATSAA